MVCSVQPVSLVAVPCWPPLWQNPSTQSSSSAHWSSFWHDLAGLQAPDTQLVPAPHSASDAHCVQWLAWQTWPPVQSPSLMHSGLATHALVVASQCWPFGQSPSAAHSTHLLSAHTSGALRSWGRWQAGSLGWVPPPAPGPVNAATPSSTAPAATTTDPT